MVKLGIVAAGVLVAPFALAGLAVGVALVAAVATAHGHLQRLVPVRV